MTKVIVPLLLLVYICIKQLEISKIMKKQILIDNRDEIIEMITLSTDNGLKDMMSAVCEIAQMGCYFDMDDMEDIINDAIEQVDNNVMKVGRSAASVLESIQIETSKGLINNI